MGRCGADIALGDPHIKWIHRREGEFDEMLARAWLRVGDFVELKRPTDGVKSCCAHRATVCRATAISPSR
jgi:hypothetical protein